MGGGHPDPLRPTVIRIHTDRRPLEEQLRHKEEAYQRWLTTVRPGTVDGDVPWEGGR